MTDGAPTDEFDPLGPFLGTALRALSDEIDAARRTVSGEIDVFDGALIDQDEDGRALYRFRVEARVPLSPETPIQLRRDERSKPVAGTLVAGEDFSVILELESGLDLTPSIPVAKLSADAAFVLSAERKRIEAALDEPDQWGPFPRYVCGVEAPPPPEEPLDSPTLAGGGGGRHLQDQGPNDRDPLNAAQREAVQRARISALLFVWGPPGTGKTTTLGHTVAALRAQGERVLVLAQANVAVDGALLAVADVVGDPPSPTSGAIVRAGVAYTDALRERPQFLLREVAAARHPEIAAELAELAARRGDIVAALVARSAPARTEELAAIRMRARELRQKLAEEEGQILVEASVVVTTAARSSLDGRIFSQRFDAVIVDEASVMGLAPALLAAGLASRRVVFFGDFRQLPPVVLAQTDGAKKLLVRDAFAASGAQEAVERDDRDAPVALLDVQYRMTAPIANVVNDTAYGNRLRTHRTDLGDRSGPWPGHSIVVVETSRLGARVVRDHGADGRSSSPFSPVHSAVSAALAAALASDGRSTAVMSPYRAHTRLLASLCGEEPEGGAPTVATVHRFQGGEAERVVFDLVDGDPMERPSPLTGGEADLARRLINVAMSRARDRLIVVGNLEFFARTLPASSPTRRALSALVREGHVVEATPAALEPATQPFLTWHPNGFTVIERLIATSTSPVAVNLPEPAAAVTQALARAVAGAPGTAAVHTGLQAAEVLEDGPATLFLDVRSGGTFAASDDRLVLCLDEPTGPAIELCGPRAVRGMRRALGI